MPPILTVLAAIGLAVGVGIGVWIAADIVLGRRRQAMRVMELVWPVTALYLGPVALWAYLRWGRAPITRAGPAAEGHGEEPPLPVSVALATSHCGAGCTIGDIVGASAVFLLGARLFGDHLWAELAADFTLAFGLGILIQYLTIAPMRGLGLRDGLVAALKADTLSLVAFEIGLFGWMILLRFGVFAADPLHPDQAEYWFTMQVGMALGFLTSYPANWWLVRRGLKERMTVRAR